MNLDANNIKIITIAIIFLILIFSGKLNQKSEALYRADSNYSYNLICIKSKDSCTVSERSRRTKNTVIKDKFKISTLTNGHASARTGGTEYNKHKYLVLERSDGRDLHLEFIYVRDSITADNELKEIFKNIKENEQYQIDWQHSVFTKK